MHPVSGLTGVFDNPELYTFLAENRLEPGIFFQEPPFENDLVPTLFAVDPSHGPSLAKTLDYIKHAPYKVFWFAVLPTCQPDLVSLASRAGATAIFFRDQWHDPSYPVVTEVLLSIPNIYRWEQSLIFHLKHHREPVSPMDTDDPLFYAATALQGAFANLNHETTIAYSWHGVWYLSPDKNFPCPFARLKRYLKAFKGRDFQFFPKPILSDRCLGLTHLLERGPLKILFVTLSPQEYSDPIRKEELPYIRQDVETYHRINQQILAPLIERAFRKIEEVNLAIRNGAHHGFVETLAGAIDTYGSSPQETPYSLSELRHIIHERIRLSNLIYSGHLYMIPGCFEKLIGQDEAVDPHRIWAQGEQGHFAFGPSDLPCGKLKYQGSAIPFNVIVALTLHECFHLFRHLAQTEGRAARVTLKLMKDRTYWHFLVSDRSERAARIQRQTWFQPFAMEHPSIMLYECYLLLKQCGGQIEDASEAHEKGNHIEFRLPKNPLGTAVIDNWQTFQKLPVTDPLWEKAMQLKQAASNAFFEELEKRQRL